MKSDSLNSFFFLFVDINLPLHNDQENGLKSLWALPSLINQGHIQKPETAKFSWAVEQKFAQKASFKI